MQYHFSYILTSQSIKYIDFRGVLYKYFISNKHDCPELMEVNWGKYQYANVKIKWTDNLFALHAKWYIIALMNASYLRFKWKQSIFEVNKFRFNTDEKHVYPLYNRK